MTLNEIHLNSEKRTGAVPDSRAPASAWAIQEKGAVNRCAGEISDSLRLELLAFTIRAHVLP